MKYKYDTNAVLFKKDIFKVKNYIRNIEYKNCQYYLAFIHEVVNTKKGMFMANPKRLKVVCW